MKPQIASSIFGNKTRCERLAVEAQKSGADLIEIRFDLCAKKITPFFCKELAASVSRRVLLPKIATFRIQEEGGSGFFHASARREKFYEAVFPFFTLVDVEMAAKDKKEIISMAKKARKKVIMSVHDLRKMPSEKHMDLLLKEGFSLGADMVKLAFFTKSQMDALRLLEFTFKHRRKPIITVALGPQGVFTRVLSGVFGSRILYGHAGKASFAHQLSVRQIKEHLTLFGCC